MELQGIESVMCDCGSDDLCPYELLYTLVHTSTLILTTMVLLAAYSLFNHSGRRGACDAAIPMKRDCLGLSRLVVICETMTRI